MATVQDSTNRVHQFLLQPAAYPDRPRHVELKETHISWVYLTDRFVYKQKKPVKFEFLDFSTRDRRRHFCEQEVRLNQRFSPEIYLGVVPVTTSADGKLQLKPGNDVVEWLVRMVRLDEQHTLENLIRDGKLSNTHVRRLSEQLSKFYVGQPPAMLRSEDFLQTLRHHVLANRQDLLRATPNSQQAILFATSSQLRCLSLEADYFIQRVCDGRVVDGHGDLRPEHVYFRGSEPVIIDCLEFNTEYRTNDVVDELAFLSMECQRLGNQSVEAALNASYLRRSCDAPRPFLGTFYKSYRACVRAKVAALRSSQQTNKECLRSLEEVLAYLELANRYAGDLGRKIVILIGGLMGTGKSTLADSLQASLAAELLRTDVIRDEFFARDATVGYGNGKYSAQGRQRVYDAMIARMGGALKRSPSVILDGTFAETATREAVAETASRQGAVVLQVQCTCPTEEALRRIASRLSRGRNASEGRPELYAEQSAGYEAVLADENLVEVNTLEPVPHQLAEVLPQIRRLISL